MSNKNATEGAHIKNEDVSDFLGTLRAENKKPSQKRLKTADFVRIKKKHLEQLDPGLMDQDHLDPPPLDDIEQQTIDKTLTKLNH